MNATENTASVRPKRAYMKGRTVEVARVQAELRKGRRMRSIAIDMGLRCDALINALRSQGYEYRLEPKLYRLTGTASERKRKA